MAEYIEREALLSKLTFENGRRIPEVDVDNFPTTVAIRDVKKLIRELPAADVATVVYGRWINDNAGVVCCSECGEEHEWEDYRASYCDTCGAKMKEAR